MKSNRTVRPTLTGPRARELRELVASCGLQLASMGLTRGNHVRVEVRSPDGRTGVVLMSRTPSDHRADLNGRAYLRRFRSAASTSAPDPNP